MSATSKLESVVAAAAADVSKAVAEYKKRNSTKDHPPRGFVQKIALAAVRPEALFDAFVDDCMK